MTVRSRTVWILGAALFCSSVGSGCRHIRRTQTTRRICNCENCRRARGEIRYDGRAPKSPGATANPSGGVKRESRAPLPSDRRASRVPFPQSPNVIEYRESTLFERVKFRLQRMNPFASSETPTTQFRPSPGSSRVPPELPEPQTTSVIFGDSDADYTTARIPAGGMKQVSRSRDSLQVEPWPHTLKKSQLAVAAGRNERTVSGRTDAADRNESRLTVPRTHPRELRPVSRSRVVESPANGDRPAFVPNASPYENYRRIRIFR